MKLLVVTEVFHPEQGLINDFAAELRKRGHEVDVLTQHPSYPAGKLFPGYANDAYRVDTWNGIAVHRFRLVEGYRESLFRKLLNYRAFVREGKRVARRIGGRYDRVLVYQTGPLTVALPALEVKRKYGTPVTDWTFDIWPDAVYAYGFPKVFPLTAFLDRLIRKVYRGSDRILVSSRRFEDAIRPYAPGHEIVYAPNWLVPETETPGGPALEPGKFHFTFTGNMSRAQNLENVLEGWKKAALPDAVLNLVGDGSRFEAVRRKVERENIQGVVLHGRYPSGAMPAVLRKSDALVLPLVADPGIEKTEPFKLQSYLRAGKPVLGILRGSGREIVEESVLGLCAAPDDTDDIARGFRDMVPFARANGEGIARRAEKLMRERFDRDTVIDRVISILNQ